MKWSNHAESKPEKIWKWINGEELCTKQENRAEEIFESGLISGHPELLRENE